MNTYQGEGTSRREQFQLNVITSLIWDFFFKWRFSFITYLVTFSGQLYFRRRYCFTLLLLLRRNSYFLQQLFLQSSCFFKESRFRKSHFLAAVIFLEYLIVRRETSMEQPLIENRKLFRVVTFRNTLLKNEVFQSGFLQ